VADRWGLDKCARCTLLAASARSIKRWEANPPSVKLGRDRLERISYVLGIFTGLHTLFGEASLADEWILRSNLDFGGASPLDRMLGGNVADLAFVRMYVDRWSAGA
jgi:hypothetical protein